ncbi:MAG: peptidoglycan-associated lipoprotein Pal [Holosporales bacterium]|jgi:peptidoglycan-associated lipoprotein|nr:peptidoglycan-associated lipoprotein Pal [Holosporales bacterium]
MERKSLLGLICSASFVLAACSCTCGIDGTKVAPGSPEDFEKNVPNAVYFNFDNYKLTPSAEARVQAQKEWLQTYTNTNIAIEGHCDDRGTQEYNLALGQRRAEEVRKNLIKHGLDGTRVTSVVSYGKERPVNTGADEKAYAENRRAVTVVVPR